MNKVYVLRIVLVTSCLFMYTKGSREISCFVNPGLNTTTGDTINTNVIHIKSEGENDVVHFVWSTYKFPSVIVARTTKNTTLSINSTKVISFEKDAITFKNEEPLESVGITFSKFWELHYDNDSSPIQEPLSVDDLHMETFSWTDVNNTLKCSSSFAYVNVKGRSKDLPFSKEGIIEIQFSVSADQGLSDQFPHLVFTGNSTLLKFILDNLYSNQSSARYGFGISLFSPILNECETGSWDTIVTSSINDEVSPGVFSDVELLAQCSDKTQLRSAFLSWRPVAYTGVKPIVANSSDVTMSSLSSTSSIEAHSIAELYFQDKSNMTLFNITFGTPGDGCYVSTKYTSWSLMGGTGTMVDVPLSTVVIILASIGIGLLILFLLSGSFFIIYKRCKEKDDDLLLN